MEEWWAEPQPRAIHKPPYAIYYPRTNPDRRRFFGCWPGDPVSDFYPPAFSADERQYPTREQYASAVAAYNAALEKAYCATPPGPMWLSVLVALTLVTSPYFVWREHKTQREALQAMKQEIVQTLRDSWTRSGGSDEWRRARRATGDGSGGGLGCSSIRGAAVRGRNWHWSTLHRRERSQCWPVAGGQGVDVLVLEKLDAPAVRDTDRYRQLW